MMTTKTDNSRDEAMISIYRTPDHKWTWQLYTASGHILGSQKDCSSWAECFTAIIEWIEPGFATPPDVSDAQAQILGLARRKSPSGGKTRAGPRPNNRKR